LILLLALLLSAIGGPIIAAPYTGNSPGTSVIHAGGPGDYTTLTSAVNPSNAATLTGGDWFLDFATDLSTTAKVMLAQETNGNWSIFRPAAGANVTITPNAPSRLSGILIADVAAELLIAHH
jgi:hypothetical protein